METNFPIKSFFCNFFLCLHRFLCVITSTIFTVGFILSVKTEVSLHGPCLMINCRWQQMVRVLRLLYLVGSPHYYYSVLQSHYTTFCAIQNFFRNLPLRSCGRLSTHPCIQNIFQSYTEFLQLLISHNFFNILVYYGKGHLLILGISNLFKCFLISFHFVMMSKHRYRRMPCWVN